MEETRASPKMEETDLIKCLERISSKIPDKLLKLRGYILKKNQYFKEDGQVFRNHGKMKVLISTSQI